LINRRPEADRTGHRDTLRLEVARGVMRALAEATEQTSALEAILADLGETLGWRVGEVWIADLDAGHLALAAYWQAQDLESDAMRDAARATRFRMAQGLSGRVWASGRSEWITDISETDGLVRVEAMRALGLRGAVAFPLRVRGDFFGVMCFFCEREEPPDPELMTMMEAVGAHVGAFLDRLRIEAALRRREEELRAEVEVVTRLRESAIAFAREHDEARLIQRITDEATELCAARFGAFFINVVGADGEAHQLYGLSGADRQAFLSFPQPRATPIFGSTFRGERVIRSDDIRRDPRFGAWGPQPAGHPTVTSYLAVPVQSRDGQVLGGLFLGHPEPGRFLDRHERAVVALAAHAAVALENARLYAELHRSERGAREARAQAEDASRRKDEFLAILGHELRNPLAPIMTALEIVRTKGAPESIARELSILRRQSGHLLRLVDDLMDLSRITRGKVHLQRNPIELAEVIATAVEEATPLIAERGHRFEVTVPRGLVVEVDEGRLVQVFVNLLTNAARYTDNGGNVRIEAHADGTRVLASVIDDGRGMDGDTLGHLFEMFAQGRRPIDRAEGGLGIGLTVVRSLIELHGGKVMAYSEGPGAGSQFTIELPRSAQVGRPSTIPPGESHPRPARRQTRVLLVDDNEDALEMLASALDALGYRVQTAADGGAGLELARRDPPEVAILDIGLPVMDGFELARRMRQDPRLAGTRLVALTGYGQPTDRSQALAAGFDEHLVKPIDVEALVAALSSS
jgi:signal transduction histidine kinase/CheY-like chemotaxis protein